MTQLDEIEHHIYRAVAWASGMDVSEETSSTNDLHEALLSTLDVAITLNKQLKEQLK